MTRNTILISILTAAAATLMSGCGKSVPSDEFDRMVNVYQTATTQVNGALSVDEVSAIAQDVKNELQLLTTDHQCSSSQEEKLASLDAQFNEACEKKVEKLQSVPEPEPADDPNAEVIVED